MRNRKGGVYVSINNGGDGANRPSITNMFMLWQPMEIMFLQEQILTPSGVPAVLLFKG